jgi:hypothetical protein
MSCGAFPDHLTPRYSLKTKLFLEYISGATVSLCKSITRSPEGLKDLGKGLQSLDRAESALPPWHHQGLAQALSADIESLAVWHRRICCRLLQLLPRSWPVHLEANAYKTLARLCLAQRQQMRVLAPSKRMRVSIHFLPKNLKREGLQKAAVAT